MAQEHKDPEDKDLDWELALIEELQTCPVESNVSNFRSNFHLLRFLKRAAVKKHHDELIATIKYYIPYVRRDFPHHVDMINEVVASLERKKSEVMIEKVAERERAAMQMKREESMMEDNSV